MAEVSAVRRRSFRFSMRTLFALIFVTAVPLAWVAKERRQSQRELSIAMELEKAGATIGFIGRFEFQPAAAPSEKPATWWRAFASHVCGLRVRSVEFGREGLVVSPFSDATALARLPFLDTLNLSLTQVEDLSPIAELDCLSTLRLSAIPARDVTPLASVKALKTLSLSNTRIKNVSPLTGLTNLTALNLSGTDVVDVAPLASLTNLTKLNLRNTNVRKIESLTTLTNLEEINIEKSKVTRGQAEYLHKKLPRCKILHDPFTVLSIDFGRPGRLKK